MQLNRTSEENSFSSTKTALSECLPGWRRGLRLHRATLDLQVPWIGSEIYGRFLPGSFQMTLISRTCRLNPRSNGMRKKSPLGRRLSSGHACRLARYISFEIRATCICRPMPLCGNETTSALHEDPKIPISTMPAIWPTNFFCTSRITERTSIGTTVCWFNMPIWSRMEAG